MAKSGRDVKKLDLQNLDVGQAVLKPSGGRIGQVAASYLRFALKLALDCPWLGKIKLDLDVTTKKLPFKEGEPNR